MRASRAFHRALLVSISVISVLVVRPACGWAAASEIRSPATQLNVELRGTWLTHPPNRSVALFEDPSTHTLTLSSVGETIHGHRILAITRGRVILEIDKQEVSLVLPSGPTGQRGEEHPGSMAVDAVGLLSAWSEVAQTLSGVAANALQAINPLRGETLFHALAPLDAQTVSHINDAIHPLSATERTVDRHTMLTALNGRHPIQVVREASLRPVIASGALKGVELASVPPTGVLQQAGFQTGDVVRAINGRRLSEPQTIVQFAHTILQAPVIQVEVERTGRVMTLTYQMKSQ